MKVVEESQNYKYLKDAIVTKNIDSEIVDEKLVLNINPKEMSLKNVETYGISVAMRNGDNCKLIGNYTYFTRLFFKGKINLYKNEKRPVLTLGSNNFTANNNIKSPYGNENFATGYDINNSDFRLSFFSKVTYQDAKGWLPNTYNLSFGNNYMTIGAAAGYDGYGVVGMIRVPEGKNVTLTFTASTTLTSAGGNRIFRIYKAKSDNSFELNNPVLKQDFNGNGVTEFKVRLKEGVYYLRQPASTNYYTATIMYDNGGYTNLKANFRTNVVNHRIKIYKFTMDNLRFSLIASTDFDGESDKVLTTVNQDYIDGESYYYMAVYTSGEADLMGMSCTIPTNVDPWMCFKYVGDSDSTFYAYNSELSQSNETFSAGINTENID